jgi:hypothetical protein
MDKYIKFPDMATAAGIVVIVLLTIAVAKRTPVVKNLV